MKIVHDQWTNGPIRINGQISGKFMAWILIMHEKSFSCFLGFFQTSFLWCFMLHNKKKVFFFRKWICFFCLPSQEIMYNFWQDFSLFFFMFCYETSVGWFDVTTFVYLFCVAEHESETRQPMLLYTNEALVIVRILVIPSI